MPPHWLTFETMGGTLSPVLNQEAQLLLHWAESQGITIVPQFIMGSRNVVADSLSRQDQVIGSEWTQVQEVVDELEKKWLAMVDLFATSLSYRLPVYFSSLNDPMAAGTDSFLCLGMVFRRTPSLRSPSYTTSSTSCGHPGDVSDSGHRRSGFQSS